MSKKYNTIIYKAYYKHLSFLDIAKFFSVSESTIYNWCRGSIPQKRFRAKFKDLSRIIA